MRLLVVEDNAELAELLAKGLQKAGYEADVLSTIEEATSVLQTTFYAALILDLGLVALYFLLPPYMLHSRAKRHRCRSIPRRLRTRPGRFGVARGIEKTRLLNDIRCKSPALARVSSCK